MDHRDIANTQAPDDVIIYRPGEYRLRDIETARTVGPKIAVIGGGTGLSTLLRGLKECTENITAIVAVSDDGGGSGTLRDELGMLPPGDIRNCILALADMEPTMGQILNYRFTDGSLAGQSFGNLFLAALCGICPTFDEAVRRMSEVLAITGSVLPVTTADVRLVAEFENGTSVRGESKIFQFKKEQKCRIRRVRLDPEGAVPLPDAIRAIEEADVVVLGPGSLYTSVIPNLLVPGVAEAIKRAPAFKVYICNVMTQEGETEGYTAADHLQSLYDHGAKDIVDCCLVNSEPIPEKLIRQYLEEGAAPTVVDRGRIGRMGIELVERPLASTDGHFARHDPGRLAYEVMRLTSEKSRRKGIYGRYDRMMVEWLAGRMAAGASAEEDKS